MNRRRALCKMLTEHPFEIFLSIAMILAAIRALMPGAVMSRTVEDGAGLLLAAAWQVCIVVGAVTVFSGLFGQAATEPANFGRVARYRVVERFGCVCMATACLVYAVVLSWSRPDGAWFPIAWSFALSAGFLVRLYVLRKRNRVVLEDLRSVSASAD